MDSTSRPVFQLHVAPPEKQNRWTVFFRYFMVIPHSFVLIFLLLAAEILTFLAWWAILFTGRNPFHEYVTNVLRWSTRVNAYLFFLTDQYPPFSISGDRDYPVTTYLAPGPMGRARVFFRIILEIPVSLVAGFLSFGTGIVGFFAWIITLFRGTLPPSLHNAFSATVRFQARVNAYAFLIQDPYPRGLFGDAAPETPIDAPALPSAPTGDVPESGSVDAQPAPEQTPPPFATTTGSLPRPPAYTYTPMVPIQMPAPSESDWQLVVTKPARRLLFVELIAGTFGYIAFITLYFVLIFSLVIPSAQGATWSLSYRSSIVGLNDGARSAVRVIDSPSPSWSSITNSCARVTTLFGVLNTVPQYPVSGPNKHLLEGVGLLDLAVKDCSQTVAPQQDAADLPALATAFNQGINQLQTFLNET